MEIRLKCKSIRIKHTSSHHISSHHVAKLAWITVELELITMSSAGLRAIELEVIIKLSSERLTSALINELQVQYFNPSIQLPLKAMKILCVSKLRSERCQNKPKNCRKFVYTSLFTEHEIFIKMIIRQRPKPRTSVYFCVDWDLM